MEQRMDRIDPHFLQLVLSLQMAAMQHMGKVVSPITGKIERDLTLAQGSIEMLGMLEGKMKGNLTDEEQELIGRILYELRLNYVDESKKPETTAEEKADKEGEQKTEQADRSDGSDPDRTSGS